MCSASRHSASCSRLPTKPGTSWSIVRQTLPACGVELLRPGHRVGSVSLAADDLDQRDQVRRVERVADHEPAAGARPGPPCRSSAKPDVLEATTTLGRRQPRRSAASSATLRSSTSGADSWTKSASSSGLGEACRPNRSRSRRGALGAGRAAPAPARRCRPAPAAGPRRRDRGPRRRRRSPCRRKCAAQPPPMTPVPTTATVRTASGGAAGRAHQPTWSRPLSPRICAGLVGRGDLERELGRGSAGSWRPARRWTRRAGRGR